MILDIYQVDDYGKKETLFRMSNNRKERMASSAVSELFLYPEYD